MLTSDLTVMFLGEWLTHFPLINSYYSIYDIISLRALRKKDQVH